MYKARIWYKRGCGPNDKQFEQIEGVLEYDRDRLDYSFKQHGEVALEAKVVTYIPIDVVAKIEVEKV